MSRYFWATETGGVVGKIKNRNPKFFRSASGTVILYLLCWFCFVVDSISGFSRLFLYMVLHKPQWAKMELIVKIGLELFNWEFYNDQQTVLAGIMQQRPFLCILTTPVPLYFSLHKIASTGTVLWHSARFNPKPKTIIWLLYHESLIQFY